MPMRCTWVGVTAGRGIGAGTSSELDPDGHARDRIADSEPRSAEADSRQRSLIGTGPADVPSTKT